MANRIRYAQEAVRGPARRRAHRWQRAPAGHQYPRLGDDAHPGAAVGRQDDHCGQRVPRRSPACRYRRALARRASRELAGFGSFDGLRVANLHHPDPELGAGTRLERTHHVRVPTRRRHEHRAAVQSLTDELSRWRGCSTSVISTRALRAWRCGMSSRTIRGRRSCTRRRTDRAPGSVQATCPTTTGTSPRPGTWLAVSCRRSRAAGIRTDTTIASRGGSRRWTPSSTSRGSLRARSSIRC